MNTAENRLYWDARAALGETAGTQDLILKALEQRALLRAIDDSPRHQRILEVGCGLGEMARLVAASDAHVTVRAIDSSPAMIAAAALGPFTVAFEVGDVSAPPIGPYDVVYSQRCLINLPDWEAQRWAIHAIADRLVPGGRFLMCEHSQDGLDFINRYRTQLGLPVITPPWHNVYFRADDLETVTSLHLLGCIPFSATYYYHSRVLNAALSEGEPDYEAPINRLARRLSHTVHPEFAQARLWIWEKR